MGREGVSEREEERWKQLEGFGALGSGMEGRGRGGSILRTPVLFKTEARYGPFFILHILSQVD